MIPSNHVAVVASLTGEVAVRSFAYQLMEQKSAVIHGHDKTLNQQRIHAHPPMVIILLVIMLNLVLLNFTLF